MFLFLIWAKREGSLGEGVRRVGLLHNMLRLAWGWGGGGDRAEGMAGEGQADISHTGLPETLHALVIRP